MKKTDKKGGCRLRLLTDIAYALGNAAIGVVSRSWWFITLGAYYAVLATARFLVLRMERKTTGDSPLEARARRMTGILLVVLSFCITGITTLSIIEGRGTDFHQIVMIAIATYTFFRITKAIVDVVKAKHSPSPVLHTLRNISLADAGVSVFALQRSMLVSFPGMENGDVRLFNILTGTATYVFVLFLGINLIGGKHVVMAKSKMAEANQKIAEAVTTGYKKIEKGVVDGYKKIEKGVVDGYTKIEDKFVDAYLTKENESVEEAKERLKEEKK